MVKKNYKEGSWFAVPLKPHGYAVGLVARNAPRGSGILAYFFGERYESPPLLEELASLRPEEAVRILHIGDLGIILGEWKVIGQSPGWDRTLWPMPKFVRREPMGGFDRLWLVTYSDDDPDRVISEELIDSVTAKGLEPDVLSGYKAAEIKLSKTLEAIEKKNRK